MPMVSQDLIDNLLAEITRQQKVIEHQTELLKKAHRDTKKKEQWWAERVADAKKEA